MESSNIIQAFDTIGLLPSLRCTVKEVCKAKRKVSLFIDKRGGRVKISHETGDTIYTLTRLNQDADLLIEVITDGGLEYHLRQSDTFTSYWNPLSTHWNGPIPGWQSKMKFLKECLVNEEAKYRSSHYDELLWERYDHARDNRLQQEKLNILEEEIDTKAKEIAMSQIDNAVNEERNQHIRIIADLEMRIRESNNKLDLAEESLRGLQTKYDKLMGSEDIEVDIEKWDSEFRSMEREFELQKTMRESVVKMGRATRRRTARLQQKINVNKRRLGQLEKAESTRIHRVKSLEKKMAQVWDTDEKAMGGNEPDGNIIVLED